MSAPFGKNALTFSDVVKQLRTTFETFTDRRTGKNTTYSLTDAGLSAFSVFFMQSPSFLEFQRAMQKRPSGESLFLRKIFPGILLGKISKNVRDR